MLTTLPWDWYTDPETLRREQQRIFRSAWAYAGHLGRLSEPGSFFTTTVGMTPIVVTRRRDGEPSIVGWQSASICKLMGRLAAWAAARQRGAVSCAASCTITFRSTSWLACSGAARVNSSRRLTDSPPSRAACVVVRSRSSSSARFGGCWTSAWRANSL